MKSRSVNNTASKEPAVKSLTAAEQAELASRCPMLGAVPSIGDALTIQDPQLRPHWSDPIWDQLYLRDESIRGIALLADDEERTTIAVLLVGKLTVADIHFDGYSKTVPILSPYVLEGPYYGKVIMISNRDGAMARLCSSSLMEVN